MKKAMSLIVVLLASFTVYIYSFTTIVLGDIYTAFPGQDSVTVLIASLPAVVMMISAFASAFLLAKFNRKILVIISMVIAVAAGLVVAYVELPVAGIVACSALMGIPAGVVAAANASVLPLIAPDSLKDKVMGFHQAALMLGQTLFALVCGFFARGGNWAGGFKTVYVIIPVIILVILFYPNIPVETEAKPKEETELKNEKVGRMPTYAILLLVTYLVGCIFWNGWYLNNSDFIINEAQLGDTTLVGGVNSLCTAVSMIGCAAVSFWMKAFKGWSLPLALLLGGVCTFLPTVIPTIPCCYIAAIGCQLGIMIAISALQTYLGLGLKGKNLTTAMSFLQAFEGSGVFLCGYVVPFIAGAFGESARHNMMVGAVATIIIGLATYTFMRRGHKQVFAEAKQ
jgi:MFS family permease